MITWNVKKHPTPLQMALGLLIKTHKKMLNHLFDYSVTCNYDEVRRFRKSAVIDARQFCPAGYVRGLIQVIADNFDLDQHTPNGKAATHTLAIIETYQMFNHNNDSQESYEFERIKWEQMSDPIPGNEFPITHYNGAEEPPLVHVPQAELPEEFTNKQMVSWNRADEADLTFLQDVMSVKGCPEYNGYMTRSSREQGHALQEDQGALHASTQSQA